MFIERQNTSLLPRLFSTRMFSDLMRNGYSHLLDEAVRTTFISSLISENSTLADVLNDTYVFLQRNYRNEYIYKNVLVNKVLLGTHSLNTSFMLSELPVASCKADMVILNGTSTVYEIKTEYDSMERLERQIAAYRQAFDRINVVTSDKSKQISQLERLLPVEVGIISLSKKNTFHTVRKAESNLQNIIPHIIFGILHKREYLSVLKKYLGEIPAVPNTQIYREALKKFELLPLNVIHAEMVSLLKLRGRKLGKFIQSVPFSLKAMSLKSNFSIGEQQCCIDILNQPISKFLT